MTRAFRLAHFFQIDPRSTLALSARELFVWEHEAQAIADDIEARTRAAREGR